MTPAASIALLWLGFAATHLALTSSRVRPRSVARFGEDVHRLLFSVVAFAFALPNLFLYVSERHQGPQLWSPATGAAELLLHAGTGCALVLMALSFVHRSPAMLGQVGQEVADAPLRGALRVTRHPLLMGLALFGVFELLGKGGAPDVAFFGGLSAFAVVGALHQDRRYLRELPGFRSFYEQTSFFPFGPRGGDDRSGEERRGRNTHSVTP